MKIKFGPQNDELVKMVKSVDLNKIFSILEFKKGDERLDTINQAINMIEIYCTNYENYKDKFLEEPLPIKRKS